jgi:hypothetical protein
MTTLCNIGLTRRGYRVVDIGAEQLLQVVVFDRVAGRVEAGQGAGVHVPPFDVDDMNCVPF